MNNLLSKYCNFHLFTGKARSLIEAGNALKPKAVSKQMLAQRKKMLIEKKKELAEKKEKIKKVHF